MSARLDIRRVRLKVDTADEGTITDAIKNKTPFTWHGNNTAVELGVFVGDELADLSQIASINVELYASTRTGNPLAKRTITQDLFNLSLTSDEWIAGTHEHVRVEFMAEEMSQTIENGTNEGSFWLVISALTTHVGAKEITLGGATFKIMRDGTGGTYSPPSVTANYYTRTESDGRYLQTQPDNANFRFDEGKYLSMFDYGTNTWRRVIIRNGALEVA